MAKATNKTSGLIRKTTRGGKVVFVKDGKELPKKSGESRFQKQQERIAKLKREATIIKRFVSPSGRETFTKGSKRLPTKKGRESFNKQQAAFKVFRFADGRPASQDVQQTLRAYPEITKGILNNLFKNSDDFKDANTNEDVLRILNDLISKQRTPKTLEIMTLIDNPEYRDRIMDKPIDIYNLMDVLKETGKSLGWKKPKTPKLKVILENGNFVIGNDAMKALFDWDTQIFEELQKKFGFAVGGIIPLIVEYKSPFIVVDLRKMNDEWILNNARFFGSDPASRGIKNWDGTKYEDS